MKARLLSFLICLTLLLTGCGISDNKGNPDTSSVGTQGQVADLGDDNKSFGEKIENTDAYDGYFEGESTDFTLMCLSGTADAYTLEGTTLTFSAIAEDSVYSIAGTFRGNIIIDVGDGHKLDLEMHGFSRC